jgi:hypothetical protein
MPRVVPPTHGPLECRDFERAILEEPINESAFILVLYYYVLPMSRLDTMEANLAAAVKRIKALEKDVGGVAADMQVTNAHLAAIRKMQQEEEAAAAESPRRVSIDVQILQEVEAAELKERADWQAKLAHSEARVAALKQERADLQELVGSGTDTASGLYRRVRDMVASGKSLVDAVTRLEDENLKLKKLQAPVHDYRYYGVNAPSQLFYHRVVPGSSLMMDMHEERDDLKTQLAAMTKERDEWKGKADASAKERDAWKANAEAAAAPPPRYSHQTPLEAMRVRAMDATIELLGRTDADMDRDDLNAQNTALVQARDALGVQLAALTVAGGSLRAVLTGHEILSQCRLMNTMFPKDAPAGMTYVEYMAALIKERDECKAKAATLATVTQEYDALKMEIKKLCAYEYGWQASEWARHAELDNQMARALCEIIVLSNGVKNGASYTATQEQMARALSATQVLATTVKETPRSRDVMVDRAAKLVGLPVPVRLDNPAEIEAVRRAAFGEEAPK